MAIAPSSRRPESTQPDDEEVIEVTVRYVGPEDRKDEFLSMFDGGASSVPSDEPAPVAKGPVLDRPSRFFYCGKAKESDREGSKHPTVKPVALMRYLVRLVTPQGGVVLDPFAGSGTTGAAAVENGVDAILIEREDQYAADIRNRFLLHMQG